MPVTPNPRIDRAVLFDRLQLVLAAPERAFSWHWLYEAALTATEPDRAELVEAVRHGRPATGMAAILAATFLDDFSRGTAELALAAQTYLGHEMPLDAGQAILNRIYARGLTNGGTSGGFVDFLRATSF